MKLVLVLATIAWAQAGRLDRDYLPPKARQSAGHGNFLKTPHHTLNRSQAQTHSSAPVANTNYAQNAYLGYEVHPERAQASRERNAAILRQDNSNDGETYSYAYETENGIFVEERGVAANGVRAQGSYSYTGDDGKLYSVRYTADENGFIPQGDHLPTPHPIPEAILKALEQNARDEAAGIFDDGSYNEVKHSGKSQQKYYNTDARPINYNKKLAIVEKDYLPPRRQRNLRRNGY